MYDAIVIGARCAGAPTAMLLARKGYHVLLVDRANFPSDTLSTHQVHVKGGAALERWGLLDAVLKTGCPPVQRVHFDIDTVKLQGKLPPLEGVDAIVCPRRILLDKILVDAAIEAGVELRENFIVEELTLQDEVVTGMRGRMKSNGANPDTAVVENARLVIGADGKRSVVARAVKAAEYHVKPVATCAYYTYWEGLDLTEGQMYSFPWGAAGIWPTNDRLSMIYTAYPVAEFQAIRGDIEGRFWKTMEAVPGLPERLHSGRQAERFYGTADLPAFYRRPYGPGWALVGDAGMTLDPMTGQGIGNAFRDAERLAEAVDAAFSGRTPLEEAMAVFEQERNDETTAMYEFTSQIASFAPPTIEQELLFAALTKKPEAADQFFGALSGSIPMDEFFAPSNLFRILGASGMSRILFNRVTTSWQSNRRQRAVL